MMTKRKACSSEVPPPAPPMPLEEEEAEDGIEEIEDDDHKEDEEVLSPDANLDDPYLDPGEVWSPEDAALEEILDNIPFPFGDEQLQSGGAAAAAAAGDDDDAPPVVVPADPEMAEAEAEAEADKDTEEEDAAAATAVAAFAAETQTGGAVVDLEAADDAEEEIEAEQGGGDDDQERLFAIFVDELDMPRRPCMEPSKQDREVFAKVPCLEEEDLLKHLSFYGNIEHLTILRTDDLSEPKGYAYIKFKTHGEADLYLGVEGPDAQWSEAERALRGKSSIYGMEMFDWFHGEWGSLKKDHLARMGIENGWVLSEHPPHKAQCGDTMALPPSIGTQLHFYVSCRPSILDDVKKTLGYILEDFHEDVLANEVHPPMSKFLGGKPVPISRKRRLAEKEQRKALMAARDVELEPVPPPKQARREVQIEAETFETVPAGKHLTWDPARGIYIEEDIPEDLLELMSGCLDGTAVPSAKPRPSRAPPGREPPLAHAAPHPAPDTLMKQGEAQVKRARNYAKSGYMEDSFRSYQLGIGNLLQALRIIESKDSNHDFTQLTSDLKYRLDLYLSEAERVQLMCTVGDHLSRKI